MKTTLATLLLLFFAGMQSVQAQSPTMGLVYRDDSVTHGYTLFSPEANKATYLVDDCGGLVNKWQFNEGPGATCYLLENGNLLRAGKDTIVIRDWNDNTVWSFAINAKMGLNQHHDLAALPNGNILCIVTDNSTLAETVAMGVDTSAVSGALEFDKVIELQPIGIDSAIIVWEWRFTDHLIQDFDSTKLNYGVVADHPELLDVNYATGFDNDFIHMNAIDYNADLDQILLSPRSLNEIIIIDHSTTTMEAAGHTGGNSGKGGDFLWRWGNPLVYRQGTVLDQQLFLQHDCKWIENGYMDAGKISVFNNLGSPAGNYSSIHIINPEIQGGTYQMANDMFLPASYDWSWNGSILGTTMFENKKSGTIALPNGHFLICETSLGRLSEIDRNGNLHWSYVNPTGPDTTYLQNNPIPSLTNRMFRGEKYPAEHPAFVGKDMTATGTIENENTISDTCTAGFLNVTDLTSDAIALINPVKNGMLVFQSELTNQLVELYDLQGKKVSETADFSGKTLKIDVNPGMYLLVLKSSNTFAYRKILVE